MVVTAHQSDMEPPSGLSHDSMGTNSRNAETVFDDYSHSNCDNFYMLDSINTPNSNNIHINTFSDDQESNCDMENETQISDLSTDFNYGYIPHKSNSYSFDNNSECSNCNSDDSICNSNTTDSETSQTSSSKDDRHVQVLESIKKAYKYTFFPHSQETKHLQMGTFYVHGTNGYEYESIVDEYGLSFSHKGTEFNPDMTIVTTNKSYSENWGNKFCDKFLCNMNFVKNSYKTTEELEREEQEKINRERQLLSQITAHNSKKLTPPHYNLHRAHCFQG